MTSVRTVAVGIFVRVGSRDDDAEHSGMAHFLEHLLFKGSTERDARALAEAMDALGGQFNAYTTREYTCFHCHTLAEHFPAAMGLLGELVCRPALRTRDVHRERAVVLDELRLLADDPQELGSDDFSHALWGDHPFGRPEAGTVQTVSNCTPDAVRSFYASRYTANAITVAVSGAIDPDEACSIADRVITPFVNARRTSVFREAPVARSSALQRVRSGEQAYVHFGTASATLSEERRWTTGILAAILGGSQSSRLFQELREQRGLCYDVGAYDLPSTDAGQFGIFLATSPEEVSKAVEYAVQSVWDIQTHGIRAGELQRNQQMAIQQIWMAQESPEARMSALGRSVALGLSPIPPQVASRRIARVTAEEVAAACHRLGPPDRWAASAVVPQRMSVGNWVWSEVD